MNLLPHKQAGVGLLTFDYLHSAVEIIHFVKENIWETTLVGSICLIATHFTVCNYIVKTTHTIGLYRYCVMYAANTSNILIGGDTHLKQKEVACHNHCTLSGRWTMTSFCVLTCQVFFLLFQWPQFAPRTTPNLYMGNCSLNAIIGAIKLTCKQWIFGYY